MIIRVNKEYEGETTESEILAVLVDYGIDTATKVDVLDGENEKLVAVRGDLTKLHDKISLRQLESIRGVSLVELITDTSKLTSLDYRIRMGGGLSTVEVPTHDGSIILGGDEYHLIGGPCSCEDEKQMILHATDAKAIGLKMLRAGAYKPRTSPQDHQGSREVGLEVLERVSNDFGLTIVTEATGERALEQIMAYEGKMPFVIQVGSRNAQSYDFLREIGDATANTTSPEKSIPVLYKRGFSQTIRELRFGIEYLMHGSSDKMQNPNVIPCLRGLRNFEPETRNTPDVGDLTVLRQLIHQVLCYDPSHQGRRDTIYDLVMQSVMGGSAVGLVEANRDPEVAVTDGAQSIWLGNVIPDGQYVPRKQRLKHVYEMAQQHYPIARENFAAEVAEKQRHHQNMMSRDA
jgi:3-deoxy-7-phosphoheptulonate synthase